MTRRLMATTCVLVALSLPTAGGAERDTGHSLTIGAELVRQESALEICLSASAAKGITMNQSALPWANRYSLLLVAVPVRSAGGKELRVTLDIDDPTVGRVVVISKEPLCGAVTLDRFPDLASERQKDDIALFWLYSVSTEPETMERYGGFVILPRVAPRRARLPGSHGRGN